MKTWESVITQIGNTVLAALQNLLKTISHFSTIFLDFKKIVNIKNLAKNVCHHFLAKPLEWIWNAETTYLILKLSATLAWPQQFRSENKFIPMSKK